ncbi:MAG: DUF4340 domain-containing protein [Clostridia bacterium]|nr:DUF4340 domain-containing protein [Clostridia bacterium]
MRPVRTALILFVVLGLLIGAYVWVSTSGTTPENPPQDANAEKIKIFSPEKDKVKSITIDHKGEKFDFEKKGEDWVYVNANGMKYDKSQITSIVSSATEMYAAKVIDEDAADLTQYGFDKPVTVTVKLTDGTLKVLELGEETAAKDGCYVREKDSKKIYTIDAYAANTLKTSKNTLRDKAIFAVKPEEVKSFTLERGGKLAFNLKAVNKGEWKLAAPFEGEINSDTVQPMINGASSVYAMNYIEENASDLKKYGLEKPLYAFEVETASGKTKILIGDEKEKGVEVYAKLSNSNSVFTVGAESVNFLDTPLKQIMNQLVYLTKIEDVSNVSVTMDGKTVNSSIQLDPNGDKEKDRFAVDGKEANGKNENGYFVYRKYFQSLISIMVSDVDVDTEPQGKPEITIEYTLKKAPGKMKIDFISKDSKYYYAMRNGKYTGILVLKEDFDKLDGVRDSYKKMMDSMNKK